MKFCSSCKVEEPRKGQRTCLSCHSAYMRLTRPKYGELPAEERRKSCTRAYTHVLIKRGKIARKPCELCKAKAEAHHPDYSKPRLVEWLCAPHHRARHLILRQA